MNDDLYMGPDHGLVTSAKTKSGLSIDFEPIYDRLLVQIIPAQEAVFNGVVIPRAVHENQPHLRGLILAAGHGRITQGGTVTPMRAKEGDYIMFLRSREDQVIIPSAPDIEIICIREHHIVGFYRNPPRVTGIVDADGKTLLEPVEPS